MASSLGVSVTERSREIGILRTVGGRPGTIRTMLAGKTILIATLACAISAMMAVPIGRVAAESFGTMVVEYPFDYRTSFGGIVAALGVAVILAVVASWAAARRAAKQPVRDALSYK